MKKPLTITKPTNTKYYLIQYNENYFRILKNKYQFEKGWEIDEFSKRKQELKDFVYSVLFDDDEFKKLERERCSLIRTKSRIRELALCNNFEYFGTLTLNGYLCNRYELDEAQKKLRYILENIKRKNKELKYIIITEKHKDGAFHFHGLFSGIDLSLNDFGYFYNEDLARLGFNSFSLIKDYNKCCNYILKYITKDCVRNSHNQIFMRSKGLRVATHEEINPIELDNNWKYENDYCCMYDIDLQNLTEFDKKLLASLIIK